jgi:hypothetical protein
MLCSLTVWCSAVTVAMRECGAWPGGKVIHLLFCVLSVDLDLASVVFVSLWGMPAKVHML